MIGKYYLMTWLKPIDGKQPTGGFEVIYRSQSPSGNYVQLERVGEGNGRLNGCFWMHKDEFQNCIIECLGD